MRKALKVIVYGYLGLLIAGISVVLLAMSLTPR